VGAAASASASPAPRAALAGLLAAAHVAAAALAPAPAAALLSSPSTQIPRSVEAALRRATPAFNEDVEQLQRKMEDIAFLLRIPQVGVGVAGGGWRVAGGGWGGCRAAVAVGLVGVRVVLR
jgi:hypothetical protein